MDTSVTSKGMSNETVRSWQQGVHSMDPSLPIQCPRSGVFSSADLQWSNDIAHIPANKVKNFVDGEGRRMTGKETSFYLRRSNYSPGPYTEWLSKRTYWCAFGPDDVPSCMPIVPPMKGTFPSSGPGSRPKARKSDYNNHQKRGCQCHFVCTRFKDTPDVAVIQWFNRNHFNKVGEPCHGIIDPKNPQPWGIRCQIAPRLSYEIKRTLMDLLRAKWSVQEVYDLHCVQQCKREDINMSEVIIAPLAGLDGRDDLIDKRDLHNLKTKVERESVIFHDNDQISVGIWIEKNPARVIFHRPYVIGPPSVDFILAFQSPEQLRLMLEFSNGKALAMDSTFATNKYGFPFFTLVCFDHHQMGLPVAWCIQHRETAEMICLFLQSVKARALDVKPDWNPSCFIIDCADAEVSALQTVFPGIPIYFCSWHVRRAWKENLILKVIKNRPKILDMNDDLGDIMYADSEEEMLSRWKCFTKTYSDEPKFIKYFEEEWMCKPEIWMRALRTMARANHNTNGATEAWHLTLKKMIRRQLGDIAGLRLDRIIDLLFCYMWPYFLYALRRNQLGLRINYKVEEVVLSSLHLAQHDMKGVQVSFPDLSKPDRAVVQSATHDGKEYVVRNIYSKFCSCECDWAEQGNMCKHQVKALLVRGHEEGIIVQQLGTRFGSQYDGMPYLEECIPALAVSVPSLEEPMLTIEESMPTFELPSQELDSGPACLKFDSVVEPDDIVPVGDNIVDNVLWIHNISKQANDRRLDDVIAEMTDIVNRNDQLYSSALATFTQGLHELKVQEQTLLVTRKDVISTNDKFKRPLGLTSKRRHGVVDLYHSGKREKAVTDPETKKKRGVRKGILERQVDEPMPTVVPSAPTPDKLPLRSTVQRESLREHLNRVQHAAITGKYTRRSKHNAHVKIPLPPKRNRNPKGLGREIHLNSEVDLNANAQ